jgi:hypothetical protein
VSNTELRKFDYKNVLMFVRKIHVEFEDHGQRNACPLKWLDNFAMRSFTNDPIFDDTLPVANGVMEIGSRVPLDRLRDALEDWFRRKSYLPKEGKLVVREEKADPSATHVAW